MLCRDRLLSFLFGDLVGFGGYEGDEFHATFYEEVTGVFAEGDRVFWGGGCEDLGDDLLDGGFGEGEILVSWGVGLLVRLGDDGGLMRTWEFPVRHS